MDNAGVSVPATLTCESASSMAKSGNELQLYSRLWFEESAVVGPSGAVLEATTVTSYKVVCTD